MAGKQLAGSLIAGDSADFAKEAPVDQDRCSAASFEQRHHDPPAGFGVGLEEPVDGLGVQVGKIAGDEQGRVGDGIDPREPDLEPDNDALILVAGQAPIRASKIRF